VAEHRSLLIPVEFSPVFFIYLFQTFTGIDLSLHDSDVIFMLAINK